MCSTCFTPVGDGDPIGWGDLKNYFGDTFGVTEPLLGGNFNLHHFGSAHTSEFNAVFADGYVHTIGYDIDGVVFNHLGARNDDLAGHPPGAASAGRAPFHSSNTSAA